MWIYCMCSCSSSAVRTRILVLTANKDRFEGEIIFTGLLSAIVLTKVQTCVLIILFSGSL